MTLKGGSFMTVPPVTPTTGTSLAGGNFQATNILDKVYSLILQMLAALQRVAVAQSERLDFLTQWQKAYSDLLDQVHTFIKSNGDGIDGTNSNEMTARDDLNRLNSSFTEMMKNRRSLLSDDGKALQSQVTQTTDNTTQQLQAATSILQTLSTILSSIYR
jgi:hypothetical protein